MISVLVLAELAAGVQTGRIFNTNSVKLLANVSFYVNEFDIFYFEIVFKTINKCYGVFKLMYDSLFFHVDVLWHYIMHLIIIILMP